MAKLQPGDPFRLPPEGTDIADDKAFNLYENTWAAQRGLAGPAQGRVGFRQ